MKRFFHAVLMLPLVLFAAACSDDDGDEAVKLESGTNTKQQVFADDTEPAPIRFTATAAWTATVTDTTPVQTKTETGKVDWLDLSAYSGKAGDVSLTMALSPNYTGHDRKAEIRIVCGGTTVVITVEQKGTTEQGEVPQDPEKPEEPTPDNPDQPENPDDKGLLDADGNIQFPDAKFAAYMVEYFDTDGDGKISVKEAATITRIHCSSRKIESVEGIKYCTELVYLYCSDNQLTALDVSNNTRLFDLRCEDNQLTALDVSNNTKLTGLYCSDNQLTTLDISNNTSLTYLDCRSNQLTALDVSNNTNLDYLYCNGNQLTALDVSNNTKLDYLRCDENQLTALDVSRTNLGNSSYYNPLYCNMPTLQTLWLKTGWVLKGINDGARDEKYIHPNTEIKYKD